MLAFPDEVPTPDGVGWFDNDETDPTIVSISDIHGYLDAARRALTAVGETDEYPPIVTSDSDGQLHWADNDYLLLVNGDLIDRGPDNDACLELLGRLVREAPPGRVRYQLGNHEMAVLFPDMFTWPGTYSIELDSQSRKQFVRAVADGTVPVAFEGYEYTYSHAGSNEPVAVGRVNETAASAAAELLGAADASERRQRGIASDHETVFGLGGVHGRGADAGLLWMDFRHMRADAPPQIVGHSRHQTPTRTGNVVCENVIRSNRNTPGGEAVLLETPDSLVAVVREDDGVTTARP